MAPVNYKSHTQLVQLWRARGSQYAGASGNLLKWQERMIQLKYARKGNSGTIEAALPTTTSTPPPLMQRA